MKRWLMAALGLLACTAAMAQVGGGDSTPALVLIVGGPPGNPGDLLARTLSGPLAGELGQPVVVENRPGAAGTVGLAAVARARPDGNVLGVLALQSAAAPALLQKIPYDTSRDLLSVRQLATVSNLLVVRADSPFHSLEDLLKAARAGTVTYASGGNGTPAHLAGELFAQEARLQLQHVPFNGAMAGVNALLGGHVQMMFATAPAVATQVEAGRLRALATAGPERLPFAAAAPTLAEVGFAGATMQDWHGLVAPAGTAVERVERVATAVGKVLASEPVRQRLVSAGLEPALSSDPGQFRAFVAREEKRWGELVRKARISLQ